MKAVAVAILQHFINTYSRTKCFEIVLVVTAKSIITKIVETIKIQHARLKIILYFFVTKNIEG